MSAWKNKASVGAYILEPTEWQCTNILSPNRKELLLRNKQHQGKLTALWPYMTLEKLLLGFSVFIIKFLPREN